MSTVALQSHAVELPRHGVPARPAPAGARADVRPHERWATLLTIAGLHLAALWALTSLSSPSAPAPVVAALQIDFVTPTPPTAAPTPPAAAPTPPRQTPPPRPRPAPVVAAPAAPDDAAPFTAPPAPETPPPVPHPAAPAPVVAAAPAPIAPPGPPAPPPAPRVLPASAVAYLVPPPIEVPLASRRLGEAGTVWLRVRVGRDGLPQQIALHRSSGFERLDRQALDAMQRARFKPQVEDGVPIEWVVVAPLQYDLH